MRTVARAGRLDAELAPQSRPQPVIADDDPAWLAAMNAPLDDTPDTEQERADVAEARATGRFVSGVEVRRAIAARRPR